MRSNIKNLKFKIIFQLQKTSGLCAQARRASDTRAPFSTVSSLSSCARAVTSQGAMALVARASTETSSLTRTSSSHTLNQVQSGPHCGIGPHYICWNYFSLDSASQVLILTWGGVLKFAIMYNGTLIGDFHNVWIKFHAYSVKGINNVFTLKNLSCMSLHAIGVFDKV